MFKQRKHKTFNYKSRFSQDDASIETSNEEDFISKWKSGNKRKVRGSMSMPALVIFLVLLLICMYFLEKKYM